MDEPRPKPTTILVSGDTDADAAPMIQVLEEEGARIFARTHDDIFYHYALEWSRLRQPSVCAFSIPNIHLEFKAGDFTLFINPRLIVLPTTLSGGVGERNFALQKLIAEARCPALFWDLAIRTKPDWRKRLLEFCGLDACGDHHAIGFV